MILLNSLLEQLIQLDTTLLLAINGAHNEYFDHFMYAFSGKVVWVPMYAALAYVIARNFSWRTALCCFVAVALTVTFADQMCATFIRPFVGRLRPSNLDSPIVDLVHIVNDYRGGRFGFPSCHAANTFGLAVFVWLLFRKRWLTTFFMAWALVTCYSRSYLGVHYPGDLLVGGLVGAFGAWLMHRLFRWISCRLSLKYGVGASDASGRRFLDASRPGQCEVKHLYAPVLVGGLTILGMLLYACW